MVLTRARFAEAGWTEVRFDAGAFVLAGFRKPSPTPVRDVRIYIEGDGRAWIRRNMPSPDPTPLDPVALELAIADPSPAVLYLARPCQFVESAQRRGCHSAIWTTHRFSEDVVAATDRAISQVKRQLEADTVTLIGFSGGGAVAALVAARRDDVAGLVTVAGVLDHRVWTTHHGVTPLFGSLNPRDFADVLGSVRQVHFVGGRDPTVPPNIARSYMAAMGEGHEATLRIRAEQEHHCCWAEVWPDLLSSAEADLRRR